MMVHALTYGTSQRTHEEQLRILWVDRLKLIDVAKEATGLRVNE